MDTPEMLPGKREVREEAARAGWSQAIGNGWAAVFVSLRTSPSGRTPPSSRRASGPLSF
jgi:hypothetical protein